MAATFYTSTRGCVYVSEPLGGGSGGGGFYQFKDGGGAVFGANTHAFITGSDLNIGDIVSPGVALDRTKVISVFGEDWGTATIGGIVLLGEAADGGRGLAGVIDFFQSNRITAKTEPCQLSLPGHQAYAVYLHRLLIQPPDPEYHIQPFAFSVSVDEG